jgi:hypothetical protein
LANGKIGFALLLIMTMYRVIGMVYKIEAFFKWKPSFGYQFDIL